MRLGNRDERLQREARHARVRRGCSMRAESGADEYRYSRRLRFMRDAARLFLRDLSL